MYFCDIIDISFCFGLSFSRVFFYKTLFQKKVAMILLQDNALEDLVSNFKKTRQGRREVDLEAADTVANKRKLQWESVREYIKMQHKNLKIIK